MALYYFHICDDEGAVPDQDGLELASLEEALREGERSARDLLNQDLKMRREVDHRRIEVWASGGEVVGVFRLRNLLN